MKQFKVNPIGKIRSTHEGMYIELREEYRAALRGLEEFSHINVLWWFDECDDEESRRLLLVNSPYKKAPRVLGTFATRSPERPNPIALSTAEALFIDHDRGLILLAYIEANDGSPVLDIKPYTPSLDRVQNPRVPAWCRHWPQCLEDSGEFAWEDEFNF